MKKISAHSKTSLFLMEMIFVLLFLALSSAACIRLFAAAKKNHIQAQEWRHIQTLTTSVGEILKTVTEPQKALSHCFLMDRFRTISSNGTMTVPGNSVPIHRLPIKWNLHYTKQRTPDREPLLSITPQMIYRFTRLIWFFLLLKIQTRRPAHERPQQLFYCHGNSLSVSDLFRALSCSAFFADTRKFPFRIKHRP